MKILFVSPAIEEKSRGIGAIFRSLVESAHNEGHDVSLLLGYPEVRPFKRSKKISTKLEHLYAQHYLNDGRDSFKDIAKRSKLKLAILEALISFSVFRSTSFSVDQNMVSTKGSLLNYTDRVIKSPFFFIVLNYLPAQLSEFILRRITRRHDIDLVIVSAPTRLKLRGSKARLAHFVHDVMPLELPEAPMDNHTPHKYGKQFLASCTNSDLLLVNSKDTATKVREANPDAKVYVLYGTASSRREVHEKSDILQRKKLQKGRYLLFTSTLEKRKNVSRLLEAYAKVHDEIDMDLVLVGAQGYGYDSIHKTYKELPKPVQRRVKFLGYVSEADKFTLFDNAFAFVFPSLYEGMGLMLIEAMQAEIPIITSRRGALPEAGGSAALYVEDPYNVDEIADALVKLKREPKLAQKLIEKGKKQRTKFTFEKFQTRFAKAVKGL